MDMLRQITEKLQLAINDKKLGEFTTEELEYSQKMGTLMYVSCVTYSTLKDKDKVDMIVAQITKDLEWEDTKQLEQQIKSLIRDKYKKTDIDKINAKVKKEKI